MARPHHEGHWSYAEGGQGEPNAVRSGHPRAPRPSSILGPTIGIGFVQVFDRKRLMVEREAELLRDKTEPAPEVALDGGDGQIAPAFVLLHLTGDDRAAVGSPQRLESARGARERADGEVPTAVRGKERAAIHHAAI